MPTWGCEKACGAGIKPFFYSSGYLNKPLSSSILAIQALRYMTAFKAHVHKGKPVMLCWGRTLPRTDALKQTRVRCQPETAAPAFPSRGSRRCTWDFPGPLLSRQQAVGGRKSCGKCMQRMRSGQPVPWQPVSHRGASIASSWVSGHRKGIREKTMSKNLPSVHKPWCHIQLHEEFHQCHVHIPLNLLRGTRTETHTDEKQLQAGAGLSVLPKPGYGVTRYGGWGRGLREEWHQRVEESQENQRQCLRPYCHRRSREVTCWRPR